MHLLIKALTGLLLCVIAPVWAANVMLIESYHYGYDWDKSYIAGLERTLGSDYTLSRFEMDTKRLPPSEFEKQADKAFAAYQATKPEIVVLGDDNALKYMLPRLYDEPISIVFLGINSNPRHLLAEYEGQAKVTGVLELPLFVRNMREISMLLGKKNIKVKVMFDSGVTSEIAAEYILRQYEQIRRSLGIEINIANAVTFQGWQREIAAAKRSGFDAIIVGLYQTLVDSEGNNVDANQVLSWTNQHVEVPTFGFWDFSVGKGKTAGGVVLFGESQGQHAADLVKQINAGADASTIPIQIGRQGRAIYSASEMERWSLTPSSRWQNID
ncbi:ABC transporter substrate-binding protein [Salinivibrio proteolyticus]|uniref:ABC transporter substrate-binding protein n=1 Tax=Salinivibrio proteolyticus TaxID=334715 RepID=UPI000988C99C|nr:hypothetical protein [Salinivibrio proteolyticus]